MQLVTVGYIVGGHAENVIPESVKFGGTFRSLTPEGLSYLRNRIKEVQTLTDMLAFHRSGPFLFISRILVQRFIMCYFQIIELQAAVHRCEAVIDFKKEKHMPHPVMVNDKALYEHTKRVGEMLVGEENVQLLPITMGAEDFGFFTQKTAALIFVVGIRNETIKPDRILHSPFFFIDEEAFPIGAALHAAVAISYLDEHALGPMGCGDPFPSS